MAQPRNRGWLIRVLNSVRSKGQLPDVIRLPQAAYDELKGNMGGKIAIPPDAPEDTAFGTVIVPDDSLVLGTVVVSAKWSPIAPEQVA